VLVVSAVRLATAALRGSAPPGAVGAALGALALLSLLVLGGCERRHDRAMYMVAGADATRGPGLIRSYGCHSCHVVPGVTGADGLVGPPLTHWSRRTFIAGELPNTPANLVAFLLDPRAFRPNTAMPATGLSREDASDIAAYLYTIP
jgi:cytochrome c